MVGTAAVPAAAGWYGDGRGEFPELNDAGFYDGGEYVYTDEENGVWRYCSDTLKVEIIRHTQDSPKQIWYEAEVWSTEDNAFAMIPWNENPDKRMSDLNYPTRLPGRTRRSWHQQRLCPSAHQPEEPAGNSAAGRGNPLGKNLRHNKGTFPNLDNLALYADGNMEVYYSDEKTAQEYQEMGAEDVLAFGPVLVRDGQLNTEALEKYGTSHAPRTAIGMVEKGHYFAMMLEGRHDGSNGAGISFLAEKMLERGCQLAFNLDGGQSATMVFMGDQICKIGGTTGVNASARKAAEILGIGVSGLVTPLEE